MGDRKFMSLAIEEAKKSTESLRCGVVIVVGGEVIAKAYNRQHESCDATAHAEILALKQAGERLRSKNVDGAVVYCTCEPCVMCLSALIFARVNRVVYGLELKEVSEIGKRIDLNIDEFLRYSPRKFEITKGVMEKECLDVSR